MKRILCAVLALIGIICVASCSSIVTSPDIDRRIVGEWENERSNMNDKWIFKGNGTFKRIDDDGSEAEGKYSAKDGILILDYGEKYAKRDLRYKVNENKNDEDYGDIKINYYYYEKVK